MAADHVQNDESVFLDIGQIFFQIFDQNLVETTLTVAITDIVCFDHIFVGNPVADAFATVVVFAP